MYEPHRGRFGLLVALVGTAHPGTYTVAYELEEDSGVTVTPLGGSATFTPYTVDPSGVHGLGVVGVGTAACDGKITVRFTWVPTAGEGPPEVAIVRETSGASWSGDEGSCENGLGHEEVDKGSTGTKYTKVTSPGGEFTWDCFPESTGTKNLTPPGPTATARVDYEAAALPVEISVSGWQWHDSKRKIQIGSRVTATVVLPMELQNEENTFQWQTPAGSLFTDYQPTTESAAYVPYVPPATQSTTFFLAKGGVSIAQKLEVKPKCVVQIHVGGEVIECAADSDPVES